MVDKLYDTWMGLCPEFKTDFGTLAPDYQLNPFPRTVSRVSDPQANGYCYSYSKSAGDNPAPKITCAGSPSVTVTMSGTATITVPVATPTSTAPAVNDIWFQMWVQTLVLGVNRMRVDPHQLDSSSQVAKRSIDEFMSKKLSNATTTVSNENSTHTTHSTHHDKVETIGSAKALKTATYVSLPVYFFSSNFTIAAPSPDDDQDLLNIRPTSYIEKDLFTKMHFDHKLFGEIVAFADMIDDQYNNKQGYTSVAALKYFRQNRTRVE